MDKRRLTYDEQVKLLQERGLTVKDTASAAEFLSRVNYYRFSGYFRYWQIAPKAGNNRFLDDSSFEVIQRLYEAEQKLVAVCDEVLHPIEVLLRTRFAYYYAQCVGAVGAFARGDGFTQSPSPDEERVEEHALSNLDRSKETFVSHYRDEIKAGKAYSVEAYARMPIWVAVEAFSFGSLSRLIEASGKSGVLEGMASSMNVSPSRLPSQVRSFVYLRNRNAHCAKLWNHAVIDRPGLLPNIARRAKRDHRPFLDHSIYKIFVALDQVATKTGLQPDWLAKRVEPILASNALLAAGIANPAHYGEMPPQLLTGND
ncbi:Abi family protein [Corynebacterium heidelbergense]|uniref:Metal ABC transporter n=1 Tax=Corynebacterium heidelbergense TaxID=2055947 RepID=A0A364VAN9_9CORY|nr:Abi family protein [Corynebacterium heidelbergense]RAV33715.1 metal ABC transporter [Corynebacterium heidelbergense]WCZ35757.1 Abi-like protein [Corynebacterium heidelbergense]